MSANPRRQFSDEQKAEAVQIATQSDRSMGQVAKELGLHENTLRKWVKQASVTQPSPDAPLASEERRELYRLRREVRHLQQEVKRLQEERDFIKKAAIFFAAESNPMS